MAEIKDGLISSFFSLEITGKLVGAFREVTNLGSENAVVEDKSRGPDGKYIIKTRVMSRRQPLSREGCRARVDPSAGGSVSYKVPS
jgi:hypothetical protein